MGTVENFRRPNQSPVRQGDKAMMCIGIGIAVFFAFGVWGLDLRAHPEHRELTITIKQLVIEKLNQFGQPHCWRDNC